MTRLFLLLGPLTLAACQRAPSPPNPVPEPEPASFDNTAAGQSIVRPEVIAEVDPTPTPSPRPTPASLPQATVLFPIGAALDKQALQVLDRFLADPALPADAQFILRGHSDAAGSDRDNLLTSRRRAEAVRAYLVSKGIDRPRITVIALGERRPVAPSATRDGADDPAGRARNRRVEVEVIRADLQPESSPTATATTQAQQSRALSPVEKPTR